MNDVKFGSWSPADSPITVEYSLVAIEEIRHEVTEGFQMLSRGGVEVAGVLYGTREGRTVSILAMRPIACEHARGPSLLLSDNDRAALEEQLRAEAQDPRLEGLICVGWFLSHTRSEIMLTESDQEVYSAYFGAPWQVTLVIRPGRGGSMRAGFFVREEDGTVRGDSSRQEFNFPDRLAGVLDRPPRAERTPMDRRFAPPPAALPRETPRAILQQTQPAWEAPDLLPAPPPRARWPWLVVAAIVILALGAMGLRYFVFPPRVEPISLAVTEKDGQLEIQWNPLAKAMNGATRGSLAIVDGKDTRTVPLAPQDLSRGSYAYQRTSGDVEVRLAVENASGEKTEEASRYLGRPLVKEDSEELKSLQQQRDDLQAEVQRLRQENATQNERIQQLDRTLRILQTRLGVK